MNTPIVLAVVVSVVASGLVALVVALLIGRAFRRGLAPVHYPCYRCGEVEGDAEYMGLHYCQMCRIVISSTYAGVRHDPPFGFPGSPGYLDFPQKGPPLEEVEEKKKEA